MDLGVATVDRVVAKLQQNLYVLIRHVSTELPHGQLDHGALFFALVMVVVLAISHLSTAAFIAYKDLSGQWDQYSLKHLGRGKLLPRNTIKTYLRHLPNVFYDWCFLLFPTLYVAGLLRKAEIYTPFWLDDATPVWNIARIAMYCCLCVVCNIVNRTWAMAVHYLLHKYAFSVHMRHHVRRRELCATSAWQDSRWEFWLMEVWGVFLFAQLFIPIPWHYQVMMVAYNGFGAAVDHCAFYVPGTVWDGRYHYVHHSLVTTNFAELECLDRWFGTLTEWSPAVYDFVERQGDPVQDKADPMSPTKPTILTGDLLSPVSTPMSTPLASPLASPQ